MAHWPRRLFALDVSRGLASLAVVLWHWQHFAFVGNSPPPDFDRAGQPWYPILRTFYEQGHAGVDYFFVLSGFIFFWLYAAPIERRTLGAREFCVQRFSRLYPLHFSTLLIVAGLQWLYVSRNPTSFVYAINDAPHFVLNLFFASSWGLEQGFSFNGPVWSVSVEVLMYTAFFVLAYWGRNRAWVLAAISVIAFVTPKHIGEAPLFRGAAMFFLGGFVFHVTVRLARDGAQRGRSVVYALVIAGWLLVVFRYHVFDFTGLIGQRKLGRLLMAAFPYYFLVPLTVAALALLEIRRGPLLASVSWVGDITYASYLLHFPLQLGFALMVSYGLLQRTFYLQPGALVAFYAVLLPLSLLVYLGFERPAQNWIRRRFGESRERLGLPARSN